MISSVWLSQTGVRTIPRANPADRSIATHVEGSTYPNSEGEDQKRIITTLTDDELRYENPVTTRGDRVEAVWKRVR